MFKFISFLLFISVFSLSFAQRLSSSPYSGFGLGEFQFDQNIVLSSMAGVSSSFISELGNEINFSNPAANQNLYYTTFNVGVTSSSSKLKANNLSEKNSASYISEVTIGVPLGDKFKMGIGFQPYSSVGYDVSRIDSLLQPDATYLKTLNKFKGEGGLNSLHSFVSYNIKPTLSVGLRVNYLFGTISKDQETFVSTANLVTGYESNAKLNSFTFTTGIAYKKEIKENYNLTLGGTLGFGLDLNSENEYLKSTYYNTSNNTKLNIDTLSYISNENKIKLPTNFSLGAAYGKSLKWNTAFEFKWMGAQSFKFPNENVSYKNNYRVAVGGWYLPNINSYKNYFEKITYRAGLYYQTGSLEINATNINQYGLTLGIGLPIGKRGRKDPSMINIGFEIGRQGTKSNNLIQEDFAKIKIGFNMNDIWFKKRVFN